MTDNLVARARAAQRDIHRIEALTARAEAAEAERDALTADNNRLREALKPFANYAKSLKGWEPTDAVCLETGIDFERVVNAGDFFAARAALKGEQK